MRSVNYLSQSDSKTGVCVHIIEQIFIIYIYIYIKYNTNKI